MAYYNLYRCKWLADGSRTIEGMADKLEQAAKELREMAIAGVRLDGVVEDDYAELITDDPEVAQRFEFQDMDATDDDDDDDFDDDGFDEDANPLGDEDDSCDNDCDDDCDDDDRDIISWHTPRVD